ncbi:hypothetical protein [Fervidibacillus halotolerans]|uniref:Uncharacterized protein n=1 Tax=Fervidibacillus halotolerans TaxID=2980027 RepID=A0A9E8M0U1_9BACI|nr:hypothetical protein [Fervidibacillus halotolerans]WAA13403.1 hypothetical protein OE105_04630 [Fervidibacillus halotolerans]
MLELSKRNDRRRFLSPDLAVDLTEKIRRRLPKVGVAGSSPVFRFYSALL